MGHHQRAAAGSDETKMNAVPSQPMSAEAPRQQIHLLHLEDNEGDHLLLAQSLRADGLNCAFTLARSKAEFSVALGRGGYDLIISDYSLPSYDGLNALHAAREQQAGTPFIFFSGTIGEDIAVDSLKHGAVDYVLKQRPGRLGAAIRAALQNAAQSKRLKQAEEALRESEERFRLVARASNDVVWEWGVQNSEVWVSGNFQGAFGHFITGPQIGSDAWFDYIHPDERGRVMAGIAGLLATGGRVWWSEHRLRRADGSYAHVFDRASIIYAADGRPQRMVGVMIDMTERRQAEEKIREQAALLDKAGDAIFVCTLERIITYWNQGAERIYGWSAAEAVGVNIRKLFFAGQMPPQLLEAEKSIAAKGEWIGELQPAAKGGRRVVVHARATLIRDHEGRPKSLFIINTDITEHKQLEEQFLRAQRMESLGELVSGIAHDLNNTLVPIIIGVEVLKSQPLGDEAAGMVHTMETSARRSIEMVKQMLLFAHGGMSVKSLVQPDHLVNEIGRIISDTFPKSVICRVQTGAHLHAVHAVPTQLHQVLINLCVNARDAMSARGTLTLTAENVKLSAGEAAELAGGRPGEFVCLGVRDTGSGIPPELMGKIFKAFFTTKPPGKGTGLGLSTTQSIVKNHDGFITVHSQPGAGTEFKIYLPAAEMRVPEPAAVPAAAPRAGGGERILVVDDEAGILAITRAALDNYSYRVTTAASGVEAVNRFRESPDAFNLVITDWVMPFMDGPTLIEVLRKIRPDIKIIVASAAEDLSGQVTQKYLVDGFISKPFTTEDLLCVVQRSLGGKKVELVDSASPGNDEFSSSPRP